jgi:hypothetical protein
MKESRRRKLMELAQPYLQQGERVEVVSVAKMGKVPVKRNVGAAGATMAAAAVVGALGGGAVVGMAFVQKEAYIMLTDRQVLLFAGDPSTGGPRKYLASIPRGAVTTSVLKDGLLFLKVRLDVAGTNQAVRLTFPPVPPSLRAAGRQFANALQRQDAYVR